MERSFAPVQLGNIELFCKAAELGGFARAAREFGLTPAAVSRAIARLEQRLSTQLFARTTRKLALTDDGRAYYVQCHETLAKLEAAEQAISGRRSIPSGTLRVSLPTTYAHYRVLPKLPEFVRQYPQLTLELNVSNRNVDFVQEGYDLAIRRLGEPKDSRLVGRRLENAALGLFALPQYLRNSPTLACMDDLPAHRHLQFVLPSTGRSMAWLFNVDGREVEYAFESTLRCSDDVLACVTLAAAGGGLFQTFDFIAAPYLARKELVEVLPSLRGRSRPFYVLYPQNRYLSTKVRTFVDFLLASLETESTVLD